VGLGDVIVHRWRIDSPPFRVEEPDTDQSASQVEQALEQVGASLVAHTEAAIAHQPGLRPLDDPPIPAQSLGGVDAASRDARGDAPGTEGTPEGQGIVGLVSVQLGRTFARPTRLASWTDDCRNGVDEGKQLGRVMGIGGRKPDGERDAVLVDDKVVFGARLAAVRRVRPRLLAPLLARTLRLSTLALGQATAASSPSQFKSRTCNFSQTPASCQSRSRRQQVVPLPQPSSWGSSRQGHPVRSTKTMPARAARSGTRGRPPFGFGGSFGRRNSMASQRASGTRDKALMARHHAIPPRFCNTVLEGGCSVP
jgi:hypothetical protein